MKTKPPKRELVKPLPKEQPFNKEEGEEKNHELCLMEEQEVVEEETLEVCLIEEQEKVMEDADESGVLVMRRGLGGLEDGKEITLAPLSPPKLHTDKPPNTQANLDIVPTCSEPLLKASHREFKVFDGCILTPFDESKAPTFNVIDLSPYLGDDHLMNLRANSSLEGEGDAHIRGYFIKIRVAQVNKSPPS